MASPRTTRVGATALPRTKLPEAMRQGRRLAILGCLLAVCLIPPDAAADPPAVLDAIFSGHRVTVPLDDLAAKAVLADDEAFRVVEIDRDAHTSHHVVAIRDREQPHHHATHDLWVVMLRGSGSMLLGDEERAVGPGSILYVPRGTVHAFRNAGSEPAIAYAVYAPAFHGADRVVVGEDAGR